MGCGVSGLIDGWFLFSNFYCYFIFETIYLFSFLVVNLLFLFLGKYVGSYDGWLGEWLCGLTVLGSFLLLFFVLLLYMLTCFFSHYVGYAS